MIILNRKRLIAMLSMICVAVFVFNFQIAKKEETISTVALPVSNKVVVIDAGHPRFYKPSVVMSCSK